MNESSFIIIESDESFVCLVAGKQPPAFVLPQRSTLTNTEGRTLGSEKTTATNQPEGTFKHYSNGIRESWMDS
jgi:hypothetical protein